MKPLLPDPKKTPDAVDQNLAARMRIEAHLLRMEGQEALARTLEESARAIVIYGLADSLCGSIIEKPLN